MNRGFAGALVLISAIAAPLTARGAGPSEAAAPAEPPTVNSEPQPHEDTPQRELHWYGWQTLASDGVWIGLLTAAATMGDSEEGSSNSSATGVLVDLSVLAYLGGGPTVHLLHHNPGRAIASISVRAGLPVVSALIGLAAENCPRPAHDDDSLCGLGGLVLGATMGVVTAMVFDASVLSWDDRLTSDAHEPAPGPQLGFTPVISSDGKRGELRLYGTF